MFEISDVASLPHYVLCAFSIIPLCTQPELVPLHNNYIPIQPPEQDHIKLSYMPCADIQKEHYTHNQFQPKQL